MDKVAFFIAHSAIANSPSLINLLEFLAKHAKVDVYLMSVSFADCPVLKKDNIEVIAINKLTYPVAKLRCLFKKYRQFIAVDPHGFVLCKDLFPACKPIYYSLELYMSYDHYGLFYPADIMKVEREKINSIKLLIIQSEEKDNLFRQDYKLSKSIPTFLLPVTYKGRSDCTKSSFIRKKYGIAEHMKIALHLGGIAEWFSCLELAQEFAKLRDWLLFFQGYVSPMYVAEIKAYLQANNINNVIISDTIYDDIDSLNDVIKSCHLGIAWYNDISIGFRTAGWSSGKISAYLRFGLPVIAKSYPSTRASIELSNSGVCIDNITEINDALNRISKNYSHYSSHAASTYDAFFNFFNYEEQLYKLILA